MVKKKRFMDLKPGQKFRYQRKVYVVDDLRCAVNIYTGEIRYSDSTLPNNTLVTPVKVYFRVK